MSKTEKQNRFSNLPRWAAILEVFGVYTSGLLLGYILIQLLGISNPIEVLKENPDFNLLTASRDLALLLFCQYIGWLLPAFLLGRWHRKRGLRASGITRADRPVGYHLLTGLVLFAVAELPVKLLELVDRIIPLGEKAYTQQMVAEMDWGNFEFWVFMAVGSFLLIPILEELFHRGYIQTRLAEDFGAPTAILAGALIFSLSHSQYLSLSAWNLGMLITSLFSAIIWGYIFYRTRSLIAVMIAHAIVNIPMRGAAVYLIPMLMLAIIFLFRERIAAEWGAFKALFKEDAISWRTTLIVLLGSLIFMILFTIAQDVVVLGGVVILVIAIILEAIEKHRQKRIVPSVDSA